MFVALLNRNTLLLLWLRSPYGALVAFQFLNAMKTYGAVNVYIHVLLISILVGGKWAASSSGHFTAPEKRSRYALGRWLIEPRADLYDEEKRTFLTVRDSNSDTSVVQPVASRFTYCTVPTPVIKYT